MAEIKITELNELRPAGSELFEDNEGYLNELSEDELDVWGGSKIELSIGNGNKITVGNGNKISDVNISISIGV